MPPLAAKVQTGGADVPIRQIQIGLAVPDMGSSEAVRAQGLTPKAVVGATTRKRGRLIYGTAMSGKLFDPEFSIQIA